MGDFKRTENDEKTLQNRANIDEERYEKIMIKVLFICHGKIWNGR